MTKSTTSEIEKLINVSDESIKVAIENSELFYRKSPIVYRMMFCCAAHPDPFDEKLTKYLAVLNEILPEICNAIEFTHNVTTTDGWLAFLCLAAATGKDMLKNWIVSAKKKGYSPLSITVAITIANNPENIRDFSISFNITGEQFNNDHSLLINVIEVSTDLVLADNNEDEEDDSDSD